MGYGQRRATRRKRAPYSKRKPRTTRVSKRRGLSARRRVYGRKRAGKRRISRVSRLSILKATSAVNNYWINGSARITGSNGRKTCNIIRALGDPADTDTVLSFLGTGAQKTLIENTHQDVWIKNQINNEMYFTAYHCIARRDVPVAEVSLQEVFNVGWLDQGDSAGGGRIGTTAFNNNKFCSYFKIMKVTKRMLKPGGVWKQMIHGRSAYINKERQSAAKQIAIGRFTRFMLLTCQGAPVNDDNSRNVVTTNEVCYDLVWNNRYQYRQMTDSANTNNFFDSLNLNVAESIMSTAEGKQAVMNVA